MDWVLSGAVVLSGIVIVFLILILLICTVWVTGRLAGGNKPQSSPPAPASAAAPKVQSGIDPQTVAVITAAVAAAMEQDLPGVPYTVTRVQRARTSRPVWGFAGMQQNTRPF